MKTSAWRALLVVGGTGVVGAALAPPAVGLVLGQMTSVASLVALVLGIRRWTGRLSAPWALLAAGGSMFVIGNVVRAVFTVLNPDSPPFPSPADALFCLGYAGVLLGALLLARRRSAGAENDSLVDALILSTACAALVVAYLLVPYWSTPALPALAKVLSGAYTLGDVVLIGVAARLAVGSGTKNTSFYLLGAAWASLVAADLLTTAGAEVWLDGRPLTLVSLLPFLLFGAACLHPTVVDLTRRPAWREERLSRTRVALLGAALVIVPVLQGWLTTTSAATRAVALLGQLGLAALVLLRLKGLVQAKERKAVRQGMLRDAGARLVAARSRHEMYETALQAAVSLASSTARRRGSAFDARASVADGDDLAVRASVGYRYRDVGERLLRPDTAGDLADLTGVRVLSAGLPLDLAPADGDDDRPSHSLLVPLRTHARLLGVLLVTTAVPLPVETVQSLTALGDQLALALVSADLNDEIHRRRHERRFRALVEQSSDLIMVIGADGLVTFVSPSVERLTGAGEGELVGSPPFARVHPDDRAEAAGTLDFVWARQSMPEPVEVRMRGIDGGWRWFELLASDLTHEPQIDGIVLHGRDVTERKVAEGQLATSEARFRSLVQQHGDLVTVLDDGWRMTYLSPSVERLLGRSVERLLGSRFTALVPAAERRRARELLTGHARSGSAELNLQHADGRSLTFELTISDLRADPAVGGLVLNARDVTDRKKLESDLRHQALHDDLTGLANRTLFAERVAGALSRREEPDALAVLFVDLDDFKTVNDGLGHGVGDELLVAVGERLRRSLVGRGIAARLGGDEFAVLLERLPGVHHAVTAAQAILADLAVPFRLADRELTIGASIGIAAGEKHGVTAQTLLRNADVAMYLAKQRGKGRFEMYRSGMRDMVFERLQMKEDLAAALDRDEFEVVYQPVVDLGTGAVSGVEALLRWQHPVRGRVSPLSFIPLAEETGLIVPIGQQVLERACRQLRTWQRQTGNPALQMSVNVSVRQLENPAFTDAVLRTLAETGIEPSRLTLEITESLLAADPQATRDRLARLKAHGVRIAMDDFGTGYSSLGQLGQLPIDVLKIDRSFVRPLGHDLDEARVVQAIIELASSRGLRVVAEGIETPEQLAILGDLGCHLGQGYLFAPPMAAPDLEDAWHDRADFRPWGDDAAALRAPAVA